MLIAEKMIQHAKLNRYCIGFFESWDLESLQAVIDAAEQMNSPVIIGFNGGIVTSNKRIIPAQNLEYIASICNIAKKNAKVPVATILNENEELETAIEGVKLGFDIVMYEFGEGDYEQYVLNMKKLVEIAHALDVIVEGSIGDLAWPKCGNKYSEEEIKKSLTDINKAVEFVKYTGVDILSVAIGNVNVLIDGKVKIDYDHLKKLNNALDIPFVLHGGSGVDDSDIKKICEFGVAKANFGALLNNAYLDGMLHALKRNKAHVSPKFLLGSGYDVDIFAHGRLALTEVVKQKIKACGSAGRAVDI